jgi:6-phosphogluconolactonase
MTRLLALLLAFSPFLAAAGETVVYVSESGHNRIAVFVLDEEAGKLSRRGDVLLEGSPGALALGADGGRLYAAVRSEKKFATLAIDPATGMPELLSYVAAAGNPAYVHPDATGRWLLAAYYGEGLVSVSPIDEDGVVSGEPVSVLDIGPKAHCIRTDPSNRFAFCPHPMDLNCVDQFRFDEATGELTLNDPPTMPGDTGAGPRHLKFHPNGKWAYVVNEQGKSVTFCHYDAERGLLSRQQTVSTHPADWEPGKGSCAEIKVSSDGRFVYASNRGHESLASFSVDAESGRLAPLERVPTEKIPRSFDLMPGERFVVAAGQGEGILALYRRDPESGRLEQVQALPCGKSPAWVMGLRLP